MDMAVIHLAHPPTFSCIKGTTFKPEPRGSLTQCSVDPFVCVCVSRHRPESSLFVLGDGRSLPYNGPNIDCGCPRLEIKGNHHRNGSQRTKRIERPKWCYFSASFGDSFYRDSTNASRSGQKNKDKNTSENSSPPLGCWCVLFLCLSEETACWLFFYGQHCSCSWSVSCVQWRSEYMHTLPPSHTNPANANAILKFPTSRNGFPHSPFPSPKRQYDHHFDRGHNVSNHNSQRQIRNKKK